MLEEKSFYRVGGSKNIHVDVHIVAATNKNLRKTIESGRFREDLFYRLNVAPILIPPLREQSEDLIPLTEYFLQEFCGTFGKSMSRIHPEAAELILAYEWKGNVRELRNAIERIVLLEEGDTLKPEHLYFLLPQERPETSEGAFGFHPMGWCSTNSTGT